jgi:hypothetical protein
MAGQWFSPGTPISSTNKTVCHNITKILLNVVLNTLTLTPVFYMLKEDHNKDKIPVHKLEAQWAEPVSLTCRSALGKLYT